MRPLTLLSAMTTWCVLASTTAAPAVETILSANFDDKTVGLPIGTGGPTVGEPVLVNSTISALIQDLPLSTPNLKINDSDLLDAGFVRFEFLHQWDIVTGVVTVSVNVLFQAYEEYVFRVRELRVRNSKKFLDLSFGSSSNIYYTDENSPTPAVIGSYAVNHEYTLVLTFDLDTDTYSVVWDGVPLLTDEPYGDTPYGIGALLFGQQADEDDDGEYNLDNLVVTATEVPTAVQPTTWARAKTDFR